MNRLQFQKTPSNEQQGAYQSLEELYDVVCADWLLEFYKTPKGGYAVDWGVGDLCDVQAHSTRGPVWLRGKIISIDPSGAVCVKILRRPAQTCRPNWIHPLHLMPHGTQCMSQRMNELWTPKNEVEWAVNMASMLSIPSACAA